MITITSKAAEKIKEILDLQGIKDPFLRIMRSISCCGVKYGLSIDKKRSDKDIILESNGIKILVDQSTYDLMNGSEIDFIKDEVFGEVFKVSNPNEVDPDNDNCNCKDKECSCS